MQIQPQQSFEIVAHLNGEKRVNESTGKLTDPEYDRVKKAFISTFTNDNNEGLFTEFLFFTPHSGYNLDDGPIAGHAWDVVSTDTGFDHARGTQGLLNVAISAGLMDILPTNIKLVENGPGTYEVWKRKTGPLLDTILDSDKHEIQSAIKFDKSRRYAQESAFGASTDYGIEEVIALKGDFINSSERIRLGQGTPLVMTWGGPFANAPSLDGGPDEIENLTQSFHNMREQHGLGAQFLIEIDLPQDVEDLKKSYSVEPADSNKRVAFRNFVLSGLYRCAYNGIIKNPDYSVLDNWEAKTTIEELTHSVNDSNGRRIDAIAQKVRLSASAKKAHEIIYDGGTLKVNQDFKPRAQILSHKFSQAIWQHAARQAGADKTRFFVEGNRALMWGEFTRKIA